MSNGVTFEWAFRGGDILVLMGYLGAGAYFFVDIKASLKVIGFRLSRIEHDQEVLDATIEDLKRTYAEGKVQDTKIERLENDASIMRTEIADLRRGVGFKEREVNGEYMRTGKVRNME